MEKTREQLRFSPDFKQACEIFDLKPLDVLQQFMDNVSLPSYFAEPMSPDRWANTFMLECVLSRLEGNDLMERFSVFFDSITEAVLSDRDDKEEVSRKIMDEWHKAVLEGRIEEIMKDN